MKKAISLILALVLCLSLCACGDNKELEKYYGTYEWEIAYMASVADYVSAKETITISKNGTGTFCVVCTKDSQYITADTVLAEGTISWEEVDGYIVITSSGTTYLNEESHFAGNGHYNFYHANGNSPLNNTKTYELKGNKLFNVESSSTTALTKVQ